MAETNASKASQEAMRENDAHTRNVNSHDHVPGDDTAHAHSHAAHLNPVHGKSNPNEVGGAKVGEVRGSAVDKRTEIDEQLRGH